MTLSLPQRTDQDGAESARSIGSPPGAGSLRVKVATTFVRPNNNNSDVKACQRGKLPFTEDVETKRDRWRWVRTLLSMAFPCEEMVK